MFVFQTEEKKYIVQSVIGPTYSLLDRYLTSIIVSLYIGTFKLLKYKMYIIIRFNVFV